MAYKELTVLSLLLIFLCNEAAAASICDPDCSSANNYDKVADPRDCRRYYVCYDKEPVPNSIACGFGQIFDPTASECKFNISGCHPVCGAGGGSGNCLLTCDLTGDKINDPFNCGIYHTCAIGGLETVKCPESAPYFDSAIGDCVIDESVCCVPGCTPYCNVASTLTPDPFDCSYYYLCLDQGQPQEELRMPCDEGQYFDLPLGKCSSTATCQVLCTSSTSPPMISATEDTGNNKSSSAQPVTTPTPGGCLESHMCESTGTFRKCDSCHSQYFECRQIGQPAEEQSCGAGYLFNPVPTFPHCILASLCPYYPFFK